MTITAIVTPNLATSTPAGNVVFLDGTTTLGTVALSNGIAKFTTSKLTVGAHAITAKYSGDVTDAASSGAGTLNITDGVVALYNQTSPNNSGTSVPIKVQLTNASGVNLSASSIVLTITAARARLAQFAFVESECFSTSGFQRAIR